MYLTFMIVVNRIKMLLQALNRLAKVKSVAFVVANLNFYFVCLTLDIEHSSKQTNDNRSAVTWRQGIVSLTSE